MIVLIRGACAIPSTPLLGSGHPWIPADLPWALQTYMRSTLQANLPSLNYPHGTVCIYGIGRTVPDRAVRYRTLPCRPAPYRTAPGRLVRYWTVPTAPSRTDRTVPHRPVPHRPEPHRTGPQAMRAPRICEPTRASRECCSLCFC